MSNLKIQKKLLTVFVFCFWGVFFGYTACGILVPQPGIKSVSPAVEARSPNHWTTREFPVIFFS